MTDRIDTVEGVWNDKLRAYNTRIRAEARVKIRGLIDRALKTQPFDIDSSGMVRGARGEEIMYFLEELDKGFLSKTEISGTPRELLGVGDNNTSYADVLIGNPRDFSLVHLENYLLDNQYDRKIRPESI